MSNSDPFEYWEASFDIEPPETVNVKELSNMALLSLYKQQSDILVELGEVLAPRTQQGRDAHSLYGACKIEIVQRGLL